MLNEDVTRYLDQSVLCWLATVSTDGVPNVSPKEVFARLDAEHLLIANIASPISVRNIRAQPAVCVSFVDILVQKGYKLVGNAVVLGKADAAYKDTAPRLAAIAGDAFPIAHVIKVRVTATTPILAPTYQLHPDTSEADQIESALKTYGVRR